MQKLWKDIEVNDIFPDGSKVLSIHGRYSAECYKVSWKCKRSKIFSSMKIAMNNCILSDTHLLLCDVSKLDTSSKKWVDENFSNYEIPTLYEKHIYYEDLGKLLSSSNINVDILNDYNVVPMDKLSQILENPIKKELKVINSDLSKVSNDLFWLPVSAIFLLITTFKQKVLCNGNKLYAEYAGNREVFCVETDTHKFKTAGLIHHNSVTLRNIIFHCLTHGEQISIALVDLKFTEFTPFKGMKNVVAVANTVQETAEIMRLARECMYKRNQELARIGINDIKDFKPQKPTEEVIIAGVKLKDTDTLEIKVDGEVKTVTVKELEGYL